MSTTAPLGKMIIELGLDTTDFGKSLQGSKREVRFWANDMKASMRAADLAGDQLGKLSAQHDGLTNIIGAQRKTVDQLKQSYDNSFVDGKPTEQTTKLAAELRNAESMLLSYTKQLVNNAGEMAKWKVLNEGLTGDLNKFGKGLTSAGKIMTSVGDTMTKKVTAPIVAGVGAAMAATIQWENGLVQMHKTIEVTDDVFQSLSDELRQLALEIPVAAHELAEIAALGGQLAVLPEHLPKFTETVAALGIATNMTSEEAATMFAQFANITNMPQTEFERLASSVVKIGNNSATTEKDVARMMMLLAGAGEAAGMTQSEIVGLAGGLSSLGIQAERGGSSFSKLIIDMAVASETGVNAAKELERQTGLTVRQLQLMASNSGADFKELADSLGMTTGEINKIVNSANKLEGFAKVAGVSAEEFAKAFGENAVNAIGLFVDGLAAGNDTGETAIQILDDLGITEIRLRDTLLRAGNAQGVLNDAVKVSNEAWVENTELQREAGIYYDSTANQLQMLRNEVMDVAIEFGGPFVNALREGVQVARPMIRSIGDLARSFSEADPETQRMIINMLGFAAAAGPVLSFSGRLATGIGGMTTKTIGFLGVMAQKKTVKDFTAQLLSGSTDIVRWGSTAAEATTATGNFGGAAATAAGSKGIGAMTGALGALSTVGWTIVGVGGLLAVGYGAWKLWGEEAWNSAQRTKEWGTDVGEVTHEALTDVQEYSRKAVGEFSLMEEGFSTNIGAMIDNFQEMGKSIENDLLRQVEAFTESINMLPEEIQGVAQEIVDDAIESRKQTLQIIEENNARVAELRQEAADNNREITTAEAKIIRGLMEESAAEYLKITIEDADARKQVMDALTGDVASATKEQATAWIQSLGEQRQATKQEYSEKLKDYKQFLDEQGILHTEEGQQLVKLFEQAKDASTEAIDAQILLIAEKYPELTEEFYYANGQMISAMHEAGEAAIAANRDILDNARTMTDQMAETAVKNAEQMAWVVDETKRGAKTWNDLVLDPKTGEVKTNAREEIIEASKSSTTWNHLRFQLQNADLDSNAKSVIGEAALVNGWWDGMAWEDKQAVLQNEFSETIYLALEEAGKWDEMSLEEQTAILYSNTPEVMVETLAHLDLWEDYIVHAKDVEADNFSFMASIRESEEKLNVWNNIDPDIKEMLGENYDLMQAIFDSETYFNVFKNIPDEEKLMIANNTDLLFAISESEENYSRWLSLPEVDKKLIGDNSDILTSIITSEIEYNRWIKLPEEDKRLLGDNTDLIQKIIASESQYQDWLTLPEYEKRLLVDNARAMSPTEDAIDLLTNYRRFVPGPKNLLITTNASATERVLQRARNEWNRISSGTRTLTLRYQTVGTPHAGGAYATGLAKGTNYHKGGPAVVNDQQGPLFREMISFPNGRSFIPGGRNVMLDLPKGSKVLKASLTKKIFPNIPQYADGVGIPADSTIIQNINRVSEINMLEMISRFQRNNKQSQLSNAQENSSTAKLVQLIIEQNQILKALLSKDASLNITRESLAESVEEHLAFNASGGYFDV